MLHHALRRLAGWLAYRESLHRLGLLDDHILTDAGFCRARLKADVHAALQHTRTR